MTTLVPFAAPKPGTGEFSPNTGAAQVRAFAQSNAVRSTQNVRFAAQHWQGSGRNGLWVSLELAPYSVVGGLGQVTETIPEALNQKLNKDVRVIVPLLSGMAASPDFKPTGWEVSLPTPGGKTEQFKLFQRSIPGKPIVYAIENETFFGKHKNIYFKQNEAPEGIGQDAIFKSVAMFNRAAAIFTDKLNEASKANKSAGTLSAVPASGPALFNGPLEFTLVHDWLTSPFLQELKPELKQSLGKVFMLHNTYNEARPIEVAQEALLNTEGINGSTYSPLTIGLQEADAVIANRNYAQRIVHTLNSKSHFTPAFQNQIIQGRVFDMHHGLSDRYNPFQNAFLSSDGYQVLDAKPFQAVLKPVDKGSINRPAKATPAILKALTQFKQANKATLQKDLGLPQNPKAPIFSWVARPEPYQKGFHLVLNSLIPFLKSHPEAQAILAGPQAGQGSPQVDAFVSQIQNDPDLAGRVALMGFVDAKQVVRIHAGSDFLMHPSLYEPYGLSQLEAMTLGNLPIVNLVDGLKSTISDPRQNRRNQVGQVGKTPAETVWQFGQNGIAMPAFDPIAYWKGLDENIKGKPTTMPAQSVVQKANEGLRKGLERAYEATQKPDTLNQWRLNGLRFVTQVHHWDAITPRYNNPIDFALLQAQQRTEAKQKQA